MQYGFLISLVTILAGFSLKAWEAYIDTNNKVKDREAKVALEQITKETLSNFMYLAILINTIEKQKPTKFWDIRRANETELAYQDRAKNHFRDYQHEIQSYLQELKYSNAVFKSFHRNLSYADTKLQEHIESTYHQLDEVIDAFERFETGLKHLLSLDLSDLERTTRSIALHQEKIINSKIAIFYAAAHFCAVLKDTTDTVTLSEYLRLIGININLQPGMEGYQMALKEVAKLSNEKVAVLSNGLKEGNSGSGREIERRISDPYLLMLRKATGLGEELSEGELSNIQNKALNRDEHEPIKLFRMAAYSYLESDGHASITYFERALKSETMSDIMKKYAQLSVDRLKNPEKYEESIGIMVLEITEGGNFDKAGIKTGDVLLSLDGKTIYEPMEIASELGKDRKSPFLVKLIRNDQLIKIVIHGGESAGAILTQLIILNAVQL
ncbi:MULTISPECIES: PDZ domain-containing protein [Nitrosomonas]|uniref:PDZ domain-containing protein n=1 Tax=Nitrosomonas communis TaxID=44574 RepID=A0A0F7KB06_9PROT|nr:MULTISPECIES: PDZ domain-containing protein [Nitrosomonas]AKH37550.1 hypothetical protein AAW31_06525 [Nitrosomonas communis]TYP92398.1 hypothetical protein BCL69_100684 [Nitrosomonas communis]UVS62808.1 PDZ domain-containing protein [Nitrosomonas sp. PLL12]